MSLWYSWRGGGTAPYTQGTMQCHHSEKDWWSRMQGFIYELLSAVWVVFLVLWYSLGRVLGWGGREREHCSPKKWFASLLLVSHGKLQEHTKEPNLLRAQNLCWFGKWPNHNNFPHSFLSYQAKCKPVTYSAPVCTRNVLYEKNCKSTLSYWPLWCKNYFLNFFVRIILWFFLLHGPNQNFLSIMFNLKTICLYLDIIFFSLTFSVSTKMVK